MGHRGLPIDNTFREIFEKIANHREIMRGALRPFLRIKLTSHRSPDVCRQPSLRRAPPLVIHSTGPAVPPTEPASRSPGRNRRLLGTILLRANPPEPRPSEIQTLTPPEPRPRRIKKKSRWIRTRTSDWPTCEFICKLLRDAIALTTDGAARLPGQNPFHQAIYMYAAWLDARNRNPNKLKSFRLRKISPGRG